MQLFCSEIANLEIEHRRIHTHCRNENAEKPYHCTVRDLFDSRKVPNHYNKKINSKGGNYDEPTEYFCKSYGYYFFDSNEF